MKLLRVSALALLVLLPSLFEAQTAKPSPVLTAPRAEMARSLEHFKKLPNPPYFLSYEVIETEGAGATGLFGALVSSTPPNRQRSLGIDLRVGSYEFDNTHPIRGATNAPAMLFEDITLERPTGDVPIPPFSGHPSFDH